MWDFVEIRMSNRIASRLGGAFAAPIAILCIFATPITFVIGVVDTWQGRSSVLVKILISVTLDAFLAVIWPVTWLLWIGLELLGRSSPLSTVLGL